MMTKDQTEGKVFELIRQIESSILLLSDFYTGNFDSKVKNFSKELELLYEMYKTDPVCQTDILKRFFRYSCEFITLLNMSYFSQVLAEKEFGNTYDRNNRKDKLLNKPFVKFGSYPTGENPYLNNELLTFYFSKIQGQHHVPKNIKRAVKIYISVNNISVEICDNLQIGSLHEDPVQMGIDFIRMSDKESEDFCSGRYKPIYPQLSYELELQHENPNYKPSEEWIASDMIVFLHYIGVFDSIKPKVKGISNTKLGQLFEPIIKQSGESIAKTLNRLDRLDISIHDSKGAKSYEKVRNHLKKFDLYNPE